MKTDCAPRTPKLPYYRYGGVVVRLVAEKLEPLMLRGEPVLAVRAAKGLFPKLPREHRARIRAALEAKTRVDRAKDRLQQLGVHVPERTVEPTPAWTDLSAVAREQA